MISFFTKIFEEECVYSIKSRALRDNLGGYTSYMGKFMKRVSCVDFPNYLSELYEETKLIVPWTLETIISKHTLYNAYSPFMTGDKQALFLDWMQGSSANLHINLGINASSIHRTNLPKYCPLCSKDDLIKHGEAYFHRLHQIPNLKVCPDHGCNIIEYTPSNNELSGFKYFSLTKQIVDHSQVTFDRCETLSKISIQFKELLIGKVESNFKEMNFKATIESKGYFKNNYLLRSELVDHFQKYYKDVKDEYLKSRIRESYHWLGGIILTPHKIFNPFQYLLFNQFIEEIQPKSIQIKHPFGCGPWICFNKASEHYMQFVISDFTLDTKYSNKIVGIFKCSCGLVYSKQLIALGQVSKEKIRVRERGFLWEEQLKLQLEKDYELSFIAKNLGTTLTTIKKLVSRKPKSKYLTEDLINEKRAEWKKCLKEFAHDSYSNSRIKYPALYKWFTRYDYNWLISTKELHQSTQLKLRLDWNEIDTKLSNQIIEIAEKLKTENLHSRVSKTLIGKLVDNGKLILSTNLQKLPKSIETLTNTTESMEEYQYRKIQNAIRDLVDADKTLNKSNIIKQAKIKHPSPYLLEKINSYLQSNGI